MQIAPMHYLNEEKEEQMPVRAGLLSEARAARVKGNDMRNLLLLSILGISYGLAVESVSAQSMLQRDVFTQREMAMQFGMFSAPWGSTLDLEGRAAYVAQQRGTAAPPDVEEPTGNIVIHTGR
jgi:hypothetical protein